MRSFWSVLLVAGVACGSDPATDGGGGSGTGAGSSEGGSASGGLPCEVSEILATHCQSCHSAEPKFGAPMPMVSRADLLAAPPKNGAATVGEAAVARVNDTANPMPPPPGMLPAAERAVLEAYVADGMPESSDTCGGGGSGAGGSGGAPLDCVPDISLKPAVPFEMPVVDDLYVCFGVEAPSDVARHITAIAPKVDNEKILHHILVLQSPEPVAAQGEPCDFVNLDWKLLYAWGPGTPAMVLPEEAGFPVGPDEPGHFVIQIHYNNIQGLVGELDQSGVDLCTTTELRPNDADIMAFGGTQFDDIGPNSMESTTCSLDIPSQIGSFLPITIFQSWPHMHQLGRQFESVIERANGDVVTLADVPNYDFDYQITYPNDDIQLGVGDQVRTTCTWENTTSQTATFGEGTGDEMCFNFVAYYPRIDFAQWSWLLPSYTATCN
jgi:hypothetical protein